jgi:hypothetical protein
MTHAGSPQEPYITHITDVSVKTRPLTLCCARVRQKSPISLVQKDLISHVPYYLTQTKRNVYITGTKGPYITRTIISHPDKEKCVYHWYKGTLYHTYHNISPRQRQTYVTHRNNSPIHDLSPIPEPYIAPNRDLLTRADLSYTIYHPYRSPILPPIETY